MIPEAINFIPIRTMRLTGLIEHLKQFELVVGFNIKRFDYQVLSGYSAYDFYQIEHP